MKTVLSTQWDGTTILTTGILNSLLGAVFTTATGLGGVILYGFSPPLVLLVTGLVALGALAVSRSLFHAD